MVTFAERTENESSFASRRHSLYRVLLLLDGEMTVRSDGREYPLSVGDAVLIPISTGYSEEYSHATFYSVYITAPDMEELASSSDAVNCLARRRLPLAVSCKGILSAVEPMISSLMHSGTVRGEAFLSLVRSLLLFIFGDECRESPAQKAKRLCEYINKNFSKRVCLDEIAKNEKISAGHVWRIFKRSYGVSPSQYLTNCRLANACKMLATTDLSVSDVAERSGFLDMSNFARSFKLSFGATPSQYRAAYR